MKSTLQIFLLSASALFLTACGSEGEDLDILGTWDVTNSGVTSYYIFSSNKLEVRTYMDEFECHTSRVIPLTIITNSTISSDDINIGEYSISGDTLTIENDLILTRTEPVPDFISCSDPSATGTLTIDIEFDHLPETFEIKSDGLDDYTSSFGLEIIFDLSTESSDDPRDLTIYADYDYEGPQASTTISMNDLDTGTYYYSGGDRDTGLSFAPYTINNNTISFNFTRSEHKLFKEITNSSAIKVRSYFIDPDSGSQQDFYPTSSTYTSGITLTNAADTVGDVAGDYDYTTIVDIKSVTVTVTEQP